MRKALLVLLAVAAAVAAPAISTGSTVPESQQQCAGDDNAGPISVEADSDSDDAGHVTLCNDDADFPLEGNITAQGDASQSCGSASIDGDPENPYLDFDQDGPGNLDGYAALEIDGNAATPIGVEETEEGDYEADCVAD